MYRGATYYNFQITVFISLEIIHCVDIDKMLHYVTFHQNLHCLQKYLLRSHYSVQRVNADTMTGVNLSRISSKSSGF